MSMGDTDLIHDLSVEFAFDAMPAAGVDLADWVKDDLLPVLEEVLDQYRGAPQRRRIERLEIDLGQVAAAHAPAELARRLFAQLSAALEEALEEVEEMPAAGRPAPDRASGQGAGLLEFLRSGTVPWACAPGGSAAPAALLRGAIESPQAHELLAQALHQPHMLTRLVRQFDAPDLLAAAAVLFDAWPGNERSAALAWAGEQARRLRAEGKETESFWRWLLPQYAVCASAGALQRQWELACAQGPAGGPREPALAGGPAGPGAAAPHALQAALENAGFAVLAPHWDRILASAPQLVRGAHQRCWQLWLRKFDAATLADILGVAQPDCGWLVECLATVVPRARLQRLMRPALRQWLAEPPGSLAPQRVLELVKARLPGYAVRIDALFSAPESGPDLRRAPMPPAEAAPQHGAASRPVRRKQKSADRAAGGLPGAVDSTPFREALRVLGPIFSRSQIIAISKSLNAGRFEQMAPYWDRLLVLAPHWLRSEYPRLAPVWLAGFDDDALIDILSVAQADCCALLEQLAGALPRRELHAALRPALASWFDLGLDSLAPQALMDQVLHTLPGARSLLESAPQAAAGLPLEQALAGGHARQLLAIWPELLLSRRADVRRIWAAMPDEQRQHAAERLAANLSIAQQIDVALILQPGVAPLMAELKAVFGPRPDGAAILASALRFTWRSEVGTAIPAGLMQSVLQQHGALPGDLAAAPMRHLAAALQAADAVPVPAPAQQAGAAWTDALRSEPALSAFLDACGRADPRFGQLDCAQLHGLVQAWAGFRQPGEAAGAFLQAVEACALRAPDPHAFFARLLGHAMRGEAIDLDDGSAGCGAIAASSQALPARRDQGAPAQSGIDAAAITTPHDNASSRSPLPELLCQALPQRLAQAMLRADLSALDALWSDIVAFHPGLLREAAQRYLLHADTRNSLIAREDGARMRDLLGCLSAPAAQLVAPLLDDPARFSKTLPAPLAAAAFAQRVVGFCFAQALERSSAPGAGAWLDGLLGAVLAVPAREGGAYGPMAYAWYELLRGGGTPLEAALEDALFGSQYLAAALRRLRPGAGAQQALPERLQRMLTMQLCSRHPGLTDQLLCAGHLADANPAVFSASEWQALARAQLPRQARTAQLAFWHEVSARLPAFAAHGGPAEPDEADEAEVQAAFAAAFAVLAPPQPQPGGASPLRAAAGAQRAEADATTIAILLMRDAPADEDVKASIRLLTERLLANAGGSGGNPGHEEAGPGAHAALRSALSLDRAVGRLGDILPAPSLARLLCVLQPGLAAVLPAVLRAIADAVPIPVPAVCMTMDGAIWRAVFAAIFNDRMPASATQLLGALAPRLAGLYPQHERALAEIVDSRMLASTPAPAATPAAAMEQLLQPLKPPAPPAPGRAAAGSGEPSTFSGDANLRNAGLAIVAPYIERLFALLDITSDGVFASDEARQRGVHLLQYVITAQESTPEHLLSLNKLLCGIPACVPVVPGIRISDREKDTIEQMLRGVISHWSALGASSVEGLRETFLQREGSLYYQDDAWHLKVPQGSFDMLLDRLPWGYKLIKFSWMAAPLNVSWR